MKANRSRKYALLLSAVLCLGGWAADPPSESPGTVTPPDLSWYRNNLTVPEPNLSKEDEEVLRQVLEGVRFSKSSNWPAPGSSVASPAGFGAQWTEVFFGFGIQNRPRYRQQPNGTGYVGFGLGDPRKWVAAEVSVGIYGLIPPGERGGMNVKIHRLITSDMGIAIGKDNLFIWGGADAIPSYYVAVSKSFQLRPSIYDWFSTLTLHGGVGNGGYRSEADYYARRESLGVFGAVGLRVLAPLGVILNWSGQDLYAGVSVTPSQRYPLVVTVAAQDLLGIAGDGIRFNVAFAFTESIFRLPLIH